MSTATLPVYRGWQAKRRAGTTPTVRGLKRIRWAVRATLILGVAASVAANVLHAEPHLISQLISAWPPVALLLTVELISRVPVHHKVLARARLIATTAIAGIAAWVSYWHMVAVAARYGETGLSAYLLPISVDGLIVVASISLVELSAQLHLAQSTPQPTPLPARSTPPATELPPGPAGHQPIKPTRPAPGDLNPLDEPPPADPADPTQGNQPSLDSSADPKGQDKTPQKQPPNASGPDTENASPNEDASDSDDTRRRRPRSTTRKAVIDAHLANPAKHPTAIADQIGTSERTVRRYLDEFRATSGNTSPNDRTGASQTHNGHPHSPQLEHTATTRA